MAKKVNVSRIHIQSIEANRRTPSMKLLNKLAETLGVESADLLEDFHAKRSGKILIDEIFENPQDVYYRGYHLNDKDVALLRRVLDALFEEVTCQDADCTDEGA